MILTGHFFQTRFFLTWQECIQGLCIRFRFSYYTKVVLKCIKSGCQTDCLKCYKDWTVIDVWLLCQWVNMYPLAHCVITRFLFQYHHCDPCTGWGVRPSCHQRGVHLHRVTWSRQWSYGWSNMYCHTQWVFHLDIFDHLHSSVGLRVFNIYIYIQFLLISKYRPKPYL